MYLICIVLGNINCDLSAILQSENMCEYTDADDDKLGSIRADQNMNILHLNKDALMVLLSDLQEKGVVIHAIGLCETFLTKESADLMHIDNYHAIHDFRQNVKARWPEEVRQSRKM